MVPAVPAEDLFRLCVYGLAVIDDMEMGLDFGEKRQRFAEASPIPQKRYRLADDIPGGIESRAGRSGIFTEIFGPLVVDIPLIEAGVKEGCVAEKAGWKHRHRPLAVEP